MTQAPFPRSTRRITGWLTRVRVPPWNQGAVDDAVTRGKVASRCVTPVSSCDEDRRVPRPRCRLPARGAGCRSGRSRRRSPGRAGQGQDRPRQRQPRLLAGRGRQAHGRPGRRAAGEPVRRRGAKSGRRLARRTTRILPPRCPRGPWPAARPRSQRRPTLPSCSPTWTSRPSNPPQVHPWCVPTGGCPGR